MAWSKTSAPCTRRSWHESFDVGRDAGAPGDLGKEALWACFDAMDYAVVLPNRLAHDDPGLSRDGFVESHLYPRRTTNYFAVSRSRRDEVRARARTIQRLGPAPGRVGG